jgi:hypothetical protein
MVPIVPTRVHGLIDYVAAVLLMIGPVLLGYSRSTPETIVPALFGLAVVGSSLFTDYEMSMYQLIPMPFHLAFDILGGLFLAASPWLFGFAHVTWIPHVAMGLFSIVMGLITSPVPSRRPMFSHAEGTI